MSDTIAAIATPGQPSAIGILRLSGPDTCAALDAVFRAKNGRPAPSCWTRASAPCLPPAAARPVPASLPSGPFSTGSWTCSRRSPWRT